MASPFVSANLKDRRPTLTSMQLIHRRNLKGINPIPMRRCNYCGMEIPEARYEFTGGYCDECRLMTADEVAAYLKTTRQTIKMMEKRGLVKGSRVGRMVRFQRADIEAYAAGLFRPEPVKRKV
jgi:excisionase family DNA binding protein